ncbi:hypothetical protein PAMP_017700 [Pampus punctatissimus]
MDTIFATLACFLLVFSFAVVQTEKGNFSSNITPTITTPALNVTHITTMVTSSNSTVHATVIQNLTDDTAFTRTSPDNETFTTTTTVTTESTNHTSQSTTIVTPLTSSTSLTTTAPATQTPTFTALTIKTTEGYTSTSDTALITTANSSSTVNTTTDSQYRTTQGLGLNFSEKNMTILFSAVLGVFAFAMVVFMVHRCKHKTQYLHQPLNDTDDTGTFIADGDTLVISGGLYDGHPIYDNVPPAPVDQSQFRLEFLH